MHYLCKSSRLQYKGSQCSTNIGLRQARRESCRTQVPCRSQPSCRNTGQSRTSSPLGSWRIPLLLSRSRHRSVQRACIWQGARCRPGQEGMYSLQDSLCSLQHQSRFRRRIPLQRVRTRPLCSARLPGICSPGGSLCSLHQLNMFRRRIPLQRARTRPLCSARLPGICSPGGSWSSLQHLSRLRRRIQCQTSYIFQKRLLPV